MGLESLKDLYLEELGDLYAAEFQMVRVLPRLSDAARAPELRDALTKHCDQSRLHLERLQLIFTHWGKRVPSRTCAGMAGIVQEADERLNQHATQDVRDAAIVGIAQRIEHYEIAAYGSARAYARQLSRPDEARLLQETLDEEGRADQRLTEIREGAVTKENDKRVDIAGPAQDVAGPTPTTDEAILGSREPLVAHFAERDCEDGADESITPPHGDKLRSKLP